MWKSSHRQKRLHTRKPSEGRTPSEKDYDRLLYSSAFRRLSGVTQVVRAGEADIFHTRQQHTLKVAQVGRRLAQRLMRESPDECGKLGLDENVVEAACLAHDLGHPPFGHMGEHVLDKLSVAAGDPDGFEGNAQSFRIITKLAVHDDDHYGLDLTRATLAACIKYPWLRDHSDPSKTNKWGAYNIDGRAFRFAREFFEGSKKTLEAEIMDWSDDVTYSVHDLDDFHRCGAIPWHKVFGSEHRSALINRALNSWFMPSDDARTRLNSALARIENVFTKTFHPMTVEPYDGSAKQRILLRSFNARMIERYIGALSINPESVGDESRRTVNITEYLEDEIRVLKQITRDYIINNPSLAAQQAGKKRILEFLFNSIREDSTKKTPHYLPVRLVYMWDLRRNSIGRFCSDCISSLTEAEATRLYMRLSGADGGSVLDPIVR